LAPIVPSGARASTGTSPFDGRVSGVRTGTVSSPIGTVRSRIFSRPNVPPFRRSDARPIAPVEQNGYADTESKR